MGDLRAFGRPSTPKIFYARETFVPLCDLNGKSTVKLPPLTLEARDELTFIKTADNGTGCIMENVRTKRRGFVSKELLIEASDFEVCRGSPWYFGAISREVANRFLGDDINVCGAFLVRKSKMHPGNYTLAVKVFNDETQEYSVSNLQITCFLQEGSEVRYKLNNISACTLQGVVEKLRESGVRSLACTGVIRLTHHCLVVRSQMPGFTGCVDPRTTSEGEVRVGGFVKDEFPGLLFRGQWRGVVDCLVKRVGMRGVKTPEVEVKREIDLMNSLRHPNILQLLANSRSTDERSGEPLYNLVFENMAHGSLSCFLRSKGQAILTFDDFFYIVDDIFTGLKYLHDQVIAHADLGAHSVFLTDTLHAKIGNMGRARFSDSQESPTLSEEHFRWQALETLETGEVTLKSDVWSLGILMWEIMTYGDLPFRGMSKRMMVQAVRQSSYTLPRPVSFCGVQDFLLLQIFETLEDCWRINPDNRIDLDKLSKSVKNIEWGYSEDPNIYHNQEMEDDFDALQICDLVEERRVSYANQ